MFPESQVIGKLVTKFQVSVFRPAGRLALSTPMTLGTNIGDGADN